MNALPFMAGDSHMTAARLLPFWGNWPKGPEGDFDPLS